jgi:hypothetical protein
MPLDEAFDSITSGLQHMILPNPVTLPDAPCTVQGTAFMAFFASRGRFMVLRPPFSTQGF